MNQNDFYKELMSKYAFDSDKIKAKAIKKAKRPFAERIILEHKAVAACACAALVLTAGVYGFASFGGNASPLDILSSNDVLSASQRLEEAEKNYALVSASSDSESELVGMFISFTEAISYSEALMTFSSVSDTGDVQPATVYLSDGTRIEKPDIAAFALSRNGEKTVLGMKIICPIAYYKEIQDLNIVYLVETASEKLGDDNFVPMRTTSETETTTPIQTTESAPATRPEDNVTIGKSEEAVAIETDVVTSAPPEQSPEDTESEPDEELNSDSATTDKPETVPVETSDTTETEPEQLDEYHIDIDGMATAAVISPTDVMVLTENGTFIYRMAGKTEAELATSFEMSKPKVEWSSVINKHVLISGCNADGVRSLIVDYNIETSEFYSYDLTGIMTAGELGGVYFSEENNSIFIKSVCTDVTNIYYIEVVGGKALASPIVSSKLPVTPLAFSNGSFVYAVSEADKTVMYSLKKGDTVASEIGTYSSAVTFTRSLFFDCYALSDVDSDGTTTTLIFDRRGASCAVKSTGPLVFGYSTGDALFCDTNGIYSIVNGMVVSRNSDETKSLFEGSADISQYKIDSMDGNEIQITRK